MSGWKSNEIENIVNLQDLRRSPWCSLPRLPQERLRARGSPTLKHQETSSMATTKMEDTAKTYLDMNDRDEVATVPAHLTAERAANNQRTDSDNDHPRIEQERR